MYQFPISKGYLIESTAELPNLTQSTEIVADFETSSGDPKKDSLNPWHHCTIAGLAIKAFDGDKTYYIPKEFLHPDWVKATFSPDKVWINHNVKYDAHVLNVDSKHCFKGRLFDTMTGAKLINSDRWTYSLDALARDWLRTSGKTSQLLAPFLQNSKDYGSVPVDKLGDYACDDVNLTLRLAKTIRSRMPEESKSVFETEQQLTSILFESEAHGLRLRPYSELETEQYKVLRELLQVIYPKLMKIVGRPFEPHKNADCLEVLHEQYKLPILAYTEEGNPSFNKHVFKQYLAIPDAPHELINLCLRWKKLWQYNNLFLETYLALGVDDIIHPNFNQCVKTGRMSCRQPNMQQLDKMAKDLIIPRDGHALLSIDYAQIEFRIIVHYIQNRYALEAYKTNPETDFHTWVAEMVEIPRRPAKNVNFMLGYGGGKKKTLAMLQDQPDLMNEIRGTCDTDAAFKLACRMRASQVYQSYHETLPELKQVSNQAAQVCRSRGYVRNVYGRRRRLPQKAAHRAFNTICQSSAADLLKERAVALMHHLNGRAKLLALVHDEFLLEVPKEQLTDSFISSIVNVLQNPSVSLRVPMRCSVKTSTDSWAACK